MKQCILLSIAFLLTEENVFSQCNPDTITGLIAKWNFSGNANDLSGNANNGTIVGATLTTDRCGKANSAYSFVGNGQYINVPDRPMLRLSNTDYTIAAWVYQNIVTSNSIRSIIAKRQSDGQRGYIFEIHSSKKLLLSVSGDTDPAAGGDSVIAQNVWVHVAITYTLSNRTVRFYVNGILNGTTDSMPSPNSATTTLLRIGNDTWGSSYGFNGKVDDIRMYNRALDSCAINALVIESCYITTYRFIGNGNWSDGSNWLNNQMPPATVLAGTQVIIDPQLDGECNVNVPITISNGASFKIIPETKIRASANLFFQR